MRFLLCLVLAGLASAQPPVRPAIVMSVWYNGPRLVPPQPLAATVSSDTLRNDLTAIRRAGFNGIVTWVSWRDGEPRRGELALSQLDRLVAVALETGLSVGVEVYTAEQPAWEKEKNNALAGAFYERVRDHYADRRPLVLVRFAGDPKGGVPFSFRVGPAPLGLTPLEVRYRIWHEFVQDQRRWSFRSDDWPLSVDMRAAGEIAGLLTRNQALFAPVTPRTAKNDVAVEPAGGIDVRILESADAIVIVGLNETDRTRRVTLTFPPDLPEAIWQNMEAGNAVNFVIGPKGPSYEHTFAPYDALVLAIRKKLR